MQLLCAEGPEGVHRRRSDNTTAAGSYQYNYKHGVAGYYRYRTRYKRVQLSARAARPGNHTIKGILFTRAQHSRSPSYRCQRLPSTAFI